MGKISQRRKRRFKRPRKMMPTWRHVIRAKSLHPRRIITLQKGGKVTLYKKRRPLRRIFYRFHDPTSYIKPFIDIIKAFQRRKKRSWSGKTKRTWAPRKSSSPSTRKTSQYKKSKDQWQMERDRLKRIFKSTEYRKFREKNEEDRFRKQLRTRYERQRLFDTARKKELRGGWRDMSKRKYKNWGPYPKRLGPALIFDITPTRKVLAAVKKAPALKGVIKNGLEDIKTELYRHAITMIGRYVPMDTGNLKISMMKSIKSTIPRPYRLKVELKADVDHAGVVNNKPESALQHFGNKRSWRTGRLLYDPKAQHGYFGLITMLLREKARLLIQDFVDDIVKIQFTGYKTRRKAGITSSPVRLYTPAKKYLHSPKVEEEIASERLANLRAKHAADKETKVTEKEYFSFDRHLIKGWFKIKGIDKRRI